MRTGRPKAELLLSDGERSQLQSFARSRSLPAALSNRARIVLSIADGELNSAIAERMKLTEATVGKWSLQFIERRIAGLYDDMRPASRARSVMSVEKLRDAVGLYRHRHQEFLSFLREIDKALPAELDIHCIVGIYATHGHPKSKTWLAARKRWHMHFIPTYSSWMNTVERFLALITNKAIRCGSFTSNSCKALSLRLGLHHQLPALQVDCRRRFDPRQAASALLT